MIPGRQGWPMTIWHVNAADKDFSDDGKLQNKTPSPLSLWKGRYYMYKYVHFSHMFQMWLKFYRVDTLACFGNHSFAEPKMTSRLLFSFLKRHSQKFHILGARIWKCLRNFHNFIGKNKKIFLIISSLGSFGY